MSILHLLRQQSKKRIGLLISSLIVFGLAVTPSIYFYTQYVEVKKSSVQGNQEELTKIRAKVGELIELPPEEPVLATVSDPEKLKTQAFFQHAENGDKVLIFSGAKKAYLYRPSIHKLIEVAALNLENQDATESVNPIASTFSVVLRNGTTIAGLTNRLEAEIKAILPDASILLKENANRRTYQSTLIIPLRTQAEAAAKLLAEKLGASVDKPNAEEPTPPEADILIIIGKDKAATPSPTL